MVPGLFKPSTVNPSRTRVLIGDLGKSHEENGDIPRPGEVLSRNVPCSY